MKPVDAQMIHQQAEILDQPVERPGIVARHRRRLAKAAHVGPHHAILPRQLWHPRPPGEPALGVAVQHEDRLGLQPGIGEIVDLVVHVEVGGRAEIRHFVSPLC
jgi:hypothetical protein